MDAETRVRLTTIICLAVVLVASIIGVTMVAITTEREVFKTAVLIFLGVCLLASFGGISWWSLRRHHWKLNVERNGESHAPDV